jgi:HPt (histidine-containing phosphotransfer) domain-containing protein
MARPASQTKFLDRDTLLRRLDGDEAFLCELIAAFMESQSSDIKRLKQALAAGNPLQIEHSAHALKGALQNFVSGGAVELAYSLELMGRNSDLEGAQAACALLEAELLLIVNQLQRVFGEFNK